MLKFENTQPEMLDQIIEIEQADAGWICPYSREQHLHCIDDPSQRHVSVYRMPEISLIGFIILQQIDNPNRALEFRRIVIAEKGRGYGRACLQWIKKYCFEELQFHRLWLDVFTDNERAIRLYESEGFVREGTLKDHLFVDGKFRSLHLYAMLEEDYEV
jgi:diamine N-acetyltransferase